ncbi:MBL fold metallo-hydrolase [Sediminispirochaeta bajacaliforniensis]|uniref:MBL fold metallo-hydrolase n=1 Tax=Sediminispirochaeta bajacaliforniensis TaxID=148 RepID=UPI000477E3B3|nr:MBL fold metallo-hydrolase [Sediminispirochaeta bajacaliforniensis]
MVERIIVGRLNTNCYIYSRWKKECVIIDPGGDHEKIISHMVEKNLTPRGIILTHGHLDHVSALGKIIDYYVEQDIHLDIAAHEDDAIFFGSGAREIHEAAFQQMGIEGKTLFQELYKPIPDIDLFLEEGKSVFDCDLSVMHTPGHTKGSVCLYSEESDMLFSGDTLFFEGVGRTDLFGGDSQALFRSINEKLMPLPDRTRVFPGHGPLTTIERERGYNPYVQ